MLKGTKQNKNIEYPTVKQATRVQANTITKRANSEAITLIYQVSNTLVQTIGQLAKQTKGKD